MRRLCCHPPGAVDHKNAPLKNEEIFKEPKNPVRDREIRNNPHPTPNTPPDA